ncbi:DUF421 domain-containing protein [Aerococcaceae bacterium DSM 111021]|nr:DUF421 domain-containing protein [Aerococcaceae bacterium DSM 111021]
MVTLINLSEVIRISLVSLLFFISLIIILRISGKRTLSKMNAFDFVITIALGSIFATIILDSSISLMSGLTAIISLVFYQFIITFLSVRFKNFKNITKSKPSLLYYNGQFFDDSLKKERIALDELKQAVRNSGFASIEDITAIVLETDGTLSVIEKASEIIL